MSEILGPRSVGTCKSKPKALSGASPGTPSSLIKGQGPAGPQPQRLPLIGQQGENLGILNQLRQLALALIEQLIG